MRMSYFFFTKAQLFSLQTYYFNVRKYHCFFFAIIFIPWIPRLSLGDDRDDRRDLSAASRKRADWRAGVHLYNFNSGERSFHGWLARMLWQLWVFRGGSRGRHVAPLTMHRGSRSARRVPPRENDRAHTRHTHVDGHMCAQPWEKRVTERERERERERGRERERERVHHFRIYSYSLSTLNCIWCILRPIRFRSCVYKISVWLENFII